MESEKITNVFETSKLLAKIKAHQILLQVSIPGISDIFFTSILDINTDKKYLLLDELNNSNGHDLLLKHKTLNIETKINGVLIQFSLNLHKVTKEDDIYIYNFDFPDTVLYFQKRSNFRINIGLGTDIPVKLKRDDRSPVYGSAINISETGIGMILDAPYSLEMGELLPLCELRISEDDNIASSLEVRYIHNDETKKQQHIGGKFIGLSAPDQKKITRLVIKLQRDLMRRLPKDDF